MCAAVDEALPVRDAWAAKTLPEKLSAVLDEAGAPAPAGVSLSEFTCYGAHSFSGTSDAQVDEQIAVLKKNNPDAYVLEAPPPAAKVRTFWVMFKRVPVLAAER